MPKANVLSKHTEFAQIAISDLDHKRLRLHMQDACENLSDIVNQMMHLIAIRARCAKEGAEVDPELFNSEIELVTLLVYHDCGLITDSELAAGLTIANKLPNEDVAKRLKDYREIALERIALLEPHWAARRENLKNEKTQWAADKAQPKSKSSATPRQASRVALQ